MLRARIKANDKIYISFFFENSYKQINSKIRTKLSNNILRIGKRSSSIFSGLLETKWKNFGLKVDEKTFS
jgi:hypothetical protein